MSLLFETERLQVRKLVFEDLDSFHEMQGNINVMRFVRGRAMTFEEDKKDLQEIIQKYNIPKNNFWIYAVVRKSDDGFLGTLAFIDESGNESEIGYRFLEKYWKQGYGTEVVTGMVLYAKSQGLASLIAYVAHDNSASDTIIKNAGFRYVEESFCKEANVKERKYRLEL